MNIDKSMIIKSFNAHFLDFINDIGIVFPERSDIQSARKALEMIRHANPIILIRVWYNRIYIPYAKEIAAGDITFFFDKDYTNDIVTPNSHNVLEIINKIREPIREMSDSSRTHTMTYIQNLSKLSALYYS